MLPSILVLAPTLVLLVGAAALMIMRLFRSTVGFTWIVAAGSVLVAWLLALFTRFRLPMVLDLPGWPSVAGGLNLIGFTADRLSWPMETALVTLVLGVIFTDSARYTQLTRAGAWAGSLAVTALGVLATLASQPLVLILGWTAIDLVEFFLLLDVAGDSKNVRQILASLGYKLAGTVLVLGNLLATPVLAGADFDVTLSPLASVSLLIGISLRVGALPLHAPFYREQPTRRGLGTVLRLAPTASTLVFLARFTPERLVWGPVPGMLLLMAGMALYGAWMWLRSDDELSGRPFWIISLASLAVTCSLRGHNTGVIAWGAVLILSGGLLFLFSARQKNLLFLPILGLLGFSGLPFSPTASAWPGLTGPPLPGLVVVYIISLALLLAGYVRKANQPGDSLQSLERWVGLIYPLGLFAMAATFLMMGIIGWPGSRTVGIWWASLSSSVIAAVYIYVSDRRLLPRIFTGRAGSLWNSFGGQFKAVLQRFLEFDWLNRILLSGYRLLAILVSRVSFLLEGEAGVLWTLVLLTLFLTILNVGSQP